MLFSSAAALAQVSAAERSAPFKPPILDKAEDRYVPAPFAAQKIGGMVGDRIDVNINRRLISGVDIEPLLQGYRKRPGQQTWIGEHISKFIDAAANAWAYSGDERLKRKLDTAVKELLATQLPDGYLGTYLEKDRFIDMGPDPWEPTAALPLWDVWAHKYNLIGLLNYYRKTGYEPALSACRRVGDLLCRVYGEGPGQRSIARNDWHVGMANTSVLEPMVELYRWTGDSKFLDFCRYIVRAWDEPKGPRIISTLLETGHVHKIGNAKAYEMMSNFVGLLELYRVTGEEQFLRPVLIAWRDIVENQLYITGTAASPEVFPEPHFLRADGSAGEGCVTVTWMQINLQLLRLTGEAKYAEEIERSVYNALLGAQHPATGLISYFVPLIGFKRYGAVSQGVPGVSCCTSSLQRGIALIPAAAWGIRRGGIAINLYVPGTVRLQLPAGEVTLTSTTRFPVDGNVGLELKMARPADFPLFLRVPAWCKEFVVTSSGQSWTGTPGEYLAIERKWKDSDGVSIRMDLPARLVPGGPAYPDHVAVQRGPQVLAAEERLNRDVPLWIAGVAGPLELHDAAAKLPEKWVGSQAYRVRGYLGNSALGRKPVELVLAPFADTGQLGGEYRVWLQRP
ncbi:MAG: glycoside hydrolase family 127 protein [Rhodospirillales bacterium]